MCLDYEQENFGFCKSFFGFLSVTPHLSKSKSLCSVELYIFSTWFNMCQTEKLFPYKSSYKFINNENITGYFLNWWPNGAWCGDCYTDCLSVLNFNAETKLVTL